MGTTKPVAELLQVVSPISVTVVNFRRFIIADSCSRSLISVVGYIMEGPEKSWWKEKIRSFSCLILIFAALFFEIRLAWNYIWIIREASQRQL